MRLHLGPIPAAPDFTPDETWRSLKEPSPWLMQLIATPIGIVASIILLLLWTTLTPLRITIPRHEAGLLIILPCFASLIIIHELIHAAVHPMKGCSPQSILGFWASRLLFYAHYDGELSRNRLLAILVAPLLAISLTPLIASCILQRGSGWIAFSSILNALMACGDILGASLVLFQLPRHAIVRNQGWKTYWKESSARMDQQASPL
jgi:hypothetical protein